MMSFSVDEGMKKCSQTLILSKFNLIYSQKDNDERDHLLANLKKEVKLLLELSVTCKFIHEDNSCFNSLCGSYIF